MTEVVQYKWKVLYRSRFIRTGKGLHKYNKVTANNLENACFIASTQCPDGFMFEGIQREDTHTFFPCGGRSAAKKEEESKITPTEGAS